MRYARNDAIRKPTRSRASPSCASYGVGCPAHTSLCLMRSISACGSNLREPGGTVNRLAACRPQPQSPPPGTAALGTPALGTRALGTAALGTAALGTAALVAAARHWRQ